MIEPKCKACNGIGWEAGGHIPCFRCNGEGYVLEDLLDVIVELENRIALLEKNIPPQGWISHPATPIDVISPSVEITTTPQLDKNIYPVITICDAQTTIIPNTIQINVDSYIDWEQSTTKGN